MKCHKCQHEFNKYEHYVSIGACQLCETCFFDLAVIELGAKERQMGRRGGSGMNETVFCPNCGDEMREWQGSIYECEECGNMIDADIFEEVCYEKR